METGDASCLIASRAPLCTPRDQFLRWDAHDAFRCNTPSVRKPGCAYLDTCVAYLDEDGQLMQEVDRDPGNNIYVRIPHPLLDPVLDSAQERLTNFFATTFWCNLTVFQCQQATRAPHLRSSLCAAVSYSSSASHHRRVSIGLTAACLVTSSTPSDAPRGPASRGRGRQMGMVLSCRAALSPLAR